MLYYLLYQVLQPSFSPLNVFRYITVRTAVASLTALFLCLVLGPWMTRKLRALQIGQYIREEGPESHQAKAGTPTMGGVLIVIAIIVPTLLWANLRNMYVWIGVLATGVFAAIGFLDDYNKVVRKRSLGLTGRTKLLLQILTSFGVGVVLLIMRAGGTYSSELIMPFFKNVRPDLVIQPLLVNPFLVPFAILPFLAFPVLVIVGASNAVNLTDGLDGLAIGPVVIAGGAFAVIAYLTGNFKAAEYLKILNVKGAGELTIFCAALVGAAIGFLWFNCYPAQVFMGDVGSLALGGSIGTLAVLTKSEMLLPVIGGLYVIEAFSVILQVASFKLTGKRIFRMAPLHHHYELAGWPEPRIIVRFWIVSFMLALLALTTLKIR